MANAVAQVGPWVKFTVAKSSREKLPGEIPAKDHGRGRTEIWQEGNNRDDNCAVRDGRELDKANKPGDAKHGAAGSERPLEATSTTAE